MRRLYLIPLVAWLVGGCADKLKEIAREPALTPVGAGLRPNRVPILSEPAPLPAYQRGNSYWQDTGADFFRDPRAMKVGDVVTVKIAIKDKASLDNTSERTRDSKRNLNLDASYNFNFPWLKGKGDGTLDTAVNSNTSSKGQGTINRSESIELLVAAVVSDVLPNGNLVIRRAAPARYRHRQQRLLRENRGGAHLLRRPRSHDRGAAAGLGPPAIRSSLAILTCRPRPLPRLPIRPRRPSRRRPSVPTCLL
jgi:flagellar L-ring protein precursor FlgH